MIHLPRTRVLRVAASLAVGTLVALAPVAAQAATSHSPAAPGGAVRPLSAQNCEQNTCMYLSTPSGGTVYISGWINTSGFTGWFQLTGPGFSYTSPTTYRAPGVGVKWTSIPAVVGQYCITGDSIYSGGQGKVCENIE